MDTVLMETERGPGLVGITGDRAHYLSATRGWLRLAAFFGFLAVVVCLTDFLIDTGLRKVRTSSFGVTNQIVRGEINADILVTGSSRAQVHYDPRVISQVTGRSAFNIGINGSQTDMQVALLKTYLRHNRKPSLVIHNLDLYAFQTTHEIYDPAQYFPYLNEEPIYRAIERVAPTEAWKWRWLPLHAYATQDLRFTWLVGFKALAGFQPPETNFNGFTPRNLKWTGDFERMRGSRHEGVTFEIEPQGVKDLEEIPTICAANGIKMVFVYSPEYVEMQALERNRQEVFALFRTIANRYGTPVWDYSDSPICRERDYFYNSQHLNADGAATYSNSIAGRLRDEYFE